MTETETLNETTDGPITSYAYTCSEHGERTAYFGDFRTRLNQVEGCNGCHKGLGVAMRAARLQEVMAGIRADIEFGNTDPGWIGERPGEWTEEQIKAAALDQMERDDEEFDRGFNEAKEERAGW